MPFFAVVDVAEIAVKPQRICSGGRRKIAKKIAKNKRCYANTLRPRIKDAVEGDEGGLGGSLPPGSP